MLSDSQFHHFACVEIVAYSCGSNSLSLNKNQCLILSLCVLVQVQVCGFVAHPKVSFASPLLFPVLTFYSICFVTRYPICLCYAAIHVSYHISPCSFLQARLRHSDCQQELGQAQRGRSSSQYPQSYKMYVRPCLNIVCWLHVMSLCVSLGSKKVG